MADSRLQTSASVHKITFDVCDMPVEEKLLPQLPTRVVVEEYLTRELEACSMSTGTLVKAAPVHSFIKAVSCAFSFHYPLTISPDHIWLLICQGFAQHVHVNAELLRHRFVQHAGKEELRVNRRFHKGAPDNDWAGVISEFNVHIQSHLVGDFYDLLVPQFSTTGAVEKVAFQISFMDIFKSYFSYSVSWCGIPSVTLEGTPADWRSIIERVQRLSAYDLEWWIEPLLPILEEFVQASKGNANRDFWERIYKEDGGSGGPYITGWLVNFFPYYEPYGKYPRRNPSLNNDREEIKRRGDKFTIGHAEIGRASVPFKWFTPEGEFEMLFVAGFMGMTQDQTTRVLRPNIGWAVCEANPRPVESSNRKLTEAEIEAFVAELYSWV